MECIGIDVDERHGREREGDENNISCSHCGSVTEARKIDKAVRAVPFNAHYCQLSPVTADIIPAQHKMSLE